MRDAIDYKTGLDQSSHTTAAQALKLGTGVCQDHAHVFISAARVLRVPARYVVGYLLALDEKLTETHAWAEAHVRRTSAGSGSIRPTGSARPSAMSGWPAGSIRRMPRRSGAACPGTPQERLSASVDISQTAEPESGINNRRNGTLVVRGTGTDMTYCVGLKLKAGLVLLSDTRTNAGVDNIARFRKMFVFEEPGERVGRADGGRQSRRHAGRRHQPHQRP